MHQLVQFLRGVGHPAAGSSQREGGANDGRQPLLRRNGPRLLHRTGDCGIWRRGPQASHRLPEQIAILRFPDGLDAGPDQLHAVAGQHTVLVEGHCQVEGGLAAHGGQQGIGPFRGDHRLHHFGGHGLDVGRVHQVGVRHDGGRIAVDQHHPKSLFLQGAAGLRTAVIEFAGLSDDDRTRADDQNAAKILPFGHGTEVRWDFDTQAIRGFAAGKPRAAPAATPKPYSLTPEKISAKKRIPPGSANPARNP